MARVACSDNAIRELGVLSGVGRCHTSSAWQGNSAAPHPGAQVPGEPGQQHALRRAEHPRAGGRRRPAGGAAPPLDGRGLRQGRRRVHPQVRAGPPPGPPPARRRLPVSARAAQDVSTPGARGPPGAAPCSTRAPSCVCGGCPGRRLSSGTALQPHGQRNVSAQAAAGSSCVLPCSLAASRM